MNRDPGTPSTFERARRKKAVRRLSESVRGDDTEELLPLDEVTRRLRLFEQRYGGVRPIPVDRIIGTVDRTREFDRLFLPRRRDIGERWKRVERAFPGGDFPPIVVYELDGSYFLVDGHHRVAISRQRGVDYIDAEVTQLRTRYPLPPDADIGQIIHTEQQRLFMEESGLDRARPEAEIEFGRAQGYPELLELVKAHGFDLMRERGEVLPLEEVAGYWYDQFYLPAVEAIRKENLHAIFPGLTDADLYVMVYQRRRALFPERGGMSFQDAVRMEKDAELGRRRTKARAALEKLRPGGGKQ